MSFTSLRPIHRFTLGVPAPIAVALKPTMQTLAATLMQDGLVQSHVILQIISLHDRSSRHLCDMLLARSALQPADLYDAVARHWNVARIDLAAMPPDPRLTAKIGHVTPSRAGVLPWRKVGQATVIVTAYPDLFPRHRAWLEQMFGPVAMAVVPLLEIEHAVLSIHGPRLAEASESRVPASESCRAYHSTTLQRPAAALAAMMSAFAVLQPIAALIAIFSVALTAMFASNIMKLVALFLMQRRTPEPRNAPVVAHLPVVSVMVALYRESNIAAKLAKRLYQLGYPRELLDILLVVEAEDQMTRQALRASDLPVWMRVIVVPDGTVKTKPRALNYALDHCRGSIVGIYDAEDAPESDQIRKIVDRFHQRGPEVVCLQGQLDYYNPRTNWLSRCFTIEYASWFRMFLPGIERMGLAIPLGGTTLFFRGLR